MLRVFVIVLGFISVINSQAQVEPELIHLIEIVRHGARSTLNRVIGADLPADIPISRLTPNGHRMHYNLGVTLRKKYPEIFTTKTTTSQINLYSSPVHRCQQSAASQLMGLYPTGLYDLKISVAPESGKVLPPFQGTQNELVGISALPQGLSPFNMLIESEVMDVLFVPSEKSCPVAGDDIAAFMIAQDKSTQELTKPVSDKLKAAGYDSKKLLNKDQFTLNDIAVIFDEVTSYLNFHDKYPAGMTPELYEQLQPFANIHFIGWYGEQAKYHKLISHSMAQQMLSTFKELKTSTDPLKRKKFSLYSGHDYNVFAFVLGWGLTSLECQTKRARGETVSGPCLDIPPFASSIVLEIRRSAEGQQLLVKPLLDGKIIKICKSQEESSSELCKMEEFEEITKSKLVWPGTQKDFLKACGNKYLLTDYPDQKPAAPQPQSNSNGGYLILGGAVVVLSVLVIVLWLRKPKQPDNNSTHLNEETLGLN